MRNPKIVVSTALDLEIAERLESLAHAHNMTMAAWMRKILVDSLPDRTTQRWRDAVAALSAAGAQTDDPTVMAYLSLPQ